MSAYSPPVDQAVREQALDPRHSFIVQAPAGSGKTGLLIQRYLKLLSCVQRPESIVAITFTRKAASEMQARILRALQQARDFPEPDADYEKVTWRLAHKALQQDQAQGWSLLDNPGCLRIQTFDSFCSKLAAQMPLLSSFGAAPSVVEESRRLYLQAAESTLAQLENKAESAQHIAVLLDHLDNRLDNLRELLADMLARRDQWLRHVANPDDPRLERGNIEQALQNIVVDALLRLVQSLSQILSLEQADELLILLRFAAGHCAGDALIASCRDIEVLPQARLETLTQWQAIAELLQTREGSWRKRITVSQGFPAPSSSRNKEEKAQLAEMKERMQDLLQALSENEDFRKRLASLENLPATHYNDHEWEILNALFALLPYSVAHLRLIFQEQGEVDFTEISLRAIQALGQGDAPSDLALKLDYQIQHLLVDEFQDTSINQYALIKNLIAGWEENDGRSLFLVGDPMQSIYRFREAEVGLFLETCQSGLAHKKLDFLQLQVNFRSCKNIIDWANEQFPDILPAQNDPVSGAVSYTASVAAKAATSEQAVNLHTCIGRDDRAEAKKIMAIIRTTPAEQNMAVLVRNRSHLLAISQQLREQGIRFQAVDIEALVDRPVVQDLLALTRALWHPADRIAWLSILRAPFCGLSLLDLHRLCVNEKARTLLDLLHDDARLTALTEDGQQRIQRVHPILEQAVQNRARQNLRCWVEHTWLALGGPACLLKDTERVDAEEFFFLLEELDSRVEAEVISELQERVERLYAKPDTGADGRLQLMTIHKAKGLEFDTVIIPGLGKAPKADSTHLLYWLEQPGVYGDTDLLFGPITSAQGEHNKTADYIQALETDKKYFENARLLYVAVTRAKQQLHLFAHTETDSHNDLRQPGRNTLLASLWPVVANSFQEQLEKQRVQQETDSEA
ncbi:MAG TPA: DNA helicase UvrD, partial [Gammaproteobacteria bacterium]|nr:DNA helicase UvrD [Gammaproteobacteria bacterium]